MGRHTPDEDTPDEEVPEQVDNLEQRDRGKDLPLHPACQIWRSLRLRLHAPRRDPLVLERAEVGPLRNPGGQPGTTVESLGSLTESG